MSAWIRVIRSSNLWSDRSVVRRRACSRREPAFWLSVAIGVLAAMSILSGCGGTARQQKASRPVATVKVAAIAPAATVAARVLARQSAIDRSAARAQLEAARLAAAHDRRGAAPSSRHRLSPSAARRRATAAAHQTSFRGLAQATACVDRARTRLVKSLAGRPPSVGQISTLLHGCTVRGSSPSRPHAKEQERDHAVRGLR